MDFHLKKQTNHARTATRQERFFSCLIKGLLCFFLVAGVIGIYTTGFGISFSGFQVYPVLFVCCLLLAFLYYNSITLNVGYLLFFAGYLVCAIRWYVPANSGFSAIRNISYDVIDEIYNFPALQYYQEILTNRSYTIPIALIVVGIGYAAIINVLISGYMSIFWSIALSAPIVIIPLYFDRTPSMVFVIFLLFSWIMIACFKFTGKYRLYKKQKNEKRITKQKKTVIRFASNGPVLFQTALLFLALSIFSGISLAALVPSNSLSLPASWYQYKNTTDEYVRNFMIQGFAMFFHKTGAGGLNGGELGQTGSVRPDFETDLEVYLIPCTNDRFYLRGYVGNEYIPVKNRWEFESVVPENTNDDSIHSWSFPFLTEMANSNPDSTLPTASLSVKNVGAASDYLYTPYFTHQSNLSGKPGITCMEDWYQGYFAKGTTNYYVYNPYTTLDFSKLPASSENQLSSEYQTSYEQLVKDKDSIYLSVPEENKEVIDQICKDGNFHGSSLEIASQVSSYFSENYPYTLKPGRTPNHTDFVNYFLTENKKGYCAHFASSAVLIFRNLGIPARYVEGYAIDSADIANSDVETENDTLASFSGDNPIENAEMVKVEVNDSSAHAWVEIYLDGFGWVPVEVTPASIGYAKDEDEDLFAGLAQFFRDAVNGSNQESDTLTFSDDTADFDRLQRQKNMEATAMAILLPSLFICLVFFLSGPFKAFLKRYRITHTKDRNQNVAGYFVLIMDEARKTECLSKDIHTQNINTYIQVLVKNQLLPESSQASYQKVVELASYSPDSLDDASYRTAMETSRTLYQKIRRIQRKEALMHLLYIKIKR
ncbi:MAG: transglutaminase-like domain-containing protein [Clostridiales bacterium]|nr:transglutaminase-like domain-containing protein [Clostridiales bacterium]